MRDKRIVVITGCSSGIGRECVRYFESKGDIVIGLARHNEDCDNFYCCDISSEENVKKVMNMIGARYRRIDVLINNAGYGLSGAVEMVPNGEIEKLYDVNILGAINCYKYAMPYMRKGSEIINIASACALFPLPYRGLYCSSKAGLHMLSLSLAMECAPLGIKVVSVCPGDIKTNFTKNRVKVFETNDRYKDRIENAARAIDSRQDKRMSVVGVARKIYNISTKRSPRPYYIIGFKYKVLHFAMRFLPTSALLHFTEKYFGGHKKV